MVLVPRPTPPSAQTDSVILAGPTSVSSTTFEHNYANYEGEEDEMVKPANLGW